MKSDVMRIYISGKVSGKEQGQFFSDFDNAEVLLRRKYPDAEIINPVAMTAGIAMNCPSFSHKEYLDLCICALDKCTHIFLMDDWNHSTGAMEEVEYALKCNHKILTSADMKVGNDQ